MHFERTRFACLGVLVAFIGLGSVHAQVLGATGANNDTTPTTTDGDITIHYVTVGKIDNTFQPNSIVAAPGDIVTFEFYPKNHSVIRSAFGYPCIPIQDVPSQKGPSPFFSGFQPATNLANPITWNLTINDTNPVFYYCGATGSCIDWGMLGVINANAETPLSTQIKLARNSQYMLLPGAEAPSEGQLASLSAAAHTATETLTVTASSPTAGASTSGAAAGNASTTSHKGLSSGAVAGIAIGTAAAALIVAGLIFLVRRNHRLERKLHDERTKSQYGGPLGSEMTTPTTYNNHNSFAGNSQTLAYVPYRDLNRSPRDPSKPFDSVVTTDSWREDDPGFGNGRMSGATPAAFTFNGEQYVAVPAREYHRASGALQVSELDSSNRESSSENGGQIS